MASLREAGLWAEPELRLQLRRLAEPTDPLYGTQWHLKNLGVGTVPGGVVEADINIQPHWATATPKTGAGINIAVIDDGLDLSGTTSGSSGGGGDGGGGGCGAGAAGLLGGLGLLLGLRRRRR